MTNLIDMIQYRIDIWSDEQFKDNPTARARKHEAETILQLIKANEEIVKKGLTCPLISNII